MDSTTEKEIPQYSDDPPKQFLQNIAEGVRRQTREQAERYRARLAVTMLTKHRGQTPSDLFGQFNSDGVWLDHPRFAQLRTTNVFQELVRGAEASFTKAKIGLEIQAKQSNFESRSCEKISRSIYEILDSEQWSEAQQQKLFYAMALTLNGYCISRFDRSSNEITMPVPEFESAEFDEDGQYVCGDCFESGEYGEETESCPECGSENISVLDEPQKIMDFLVSAFTDKPAGKPEMIVVSGLQMSVDDRNGVPADIASANWCEWRQLVPKAELKRLYGYEPEGSPDWSYQTMLQQGFKYHRNGEYSPTSEFDKKFYELRTIWLDPVEYEDYVAPKSCKIHDKEIKKGDKFIELYPKGLVMGVVGTTIVFIDAEDKNRHVKSALWLAQGESFYGIGMSAGVGIQQKINQLETIIMEGEARSIKGSLLYDPTAVDGKHLEGANVNIPLRPDFSMQGRNFNEVLHELTVEGLSATSAAYLQSQSDTMQRVMGVPDVSLGIGDENSQTASGQQLIAANALGILVPAKKSEGMLKEGWLRDQLELIREFYPPQAIQRFGQKYGEEWMPEEIDAFLNADLDEAISIDVVDGSEIPETRRGKQEKLRADIANGFIQPSPRVMAQLAFESGYGGLDVLNYDSNHEIAKKRFNFLFETIVESQPDIGDAFAFYESLTMNPDGTPITDEMGNTIPNPVVSQILTAPEMQIHKYAEDQQLQYDFWGEKGRQVIAGSASDSMSRFQAAVCEAMMTAHKQQAFNNQVIDQTLNGVIGMPAQVGGALTQQALTPPEEGDKKPAPKKK